MHHLHSATAVRFKWNITKRTSDSSASLQLIKSFQLQGNKLTHTQTRVLSWAFWQDLPVRLFMLISSYSIHTLQERPKIWVLFHCESERTAATQSNHMGEINSFMYADLRMVLLEVELCFLQFPQSTQQDSSLHHRAGVELGFDVQQVALHRHPDRKSRWTCTPSYISVRIFPSMTNTLTVRQGLLFIRIT